MDSKKEHSKTLRNILVVREELLRFPRSVWKLRWLSSINLRLDEISILIVFQFYWKISRNQLEIVVEGTYSQHPNQYFEILNLRFRRKHQLTKRFKLHSNSRGTPEIRDLPIWKIFAHRNTQLLLLFSICLRDKTDENKINFT